MIFHTILDIEGLYNHGLVHFLNWVYQVCYDYLLISSLFKFMVRLAFPTESLFRPSKWPVEQALTRSFHKSAVKEIELQLINRT